MKDIKVFLFFIFIFLFNINIIYAEGFGITSKEVVLYNLNDDNIIYELNKDERVPVASLTKIMTAVIAIENIDNLDDKVIITNDVFVGLEGYSKAGFNVGDEVTYRDLLYGVILPSGADAVNAIVKNTTGNLDSFVALMNEKASILGMDNTYFDNAIGMDNVNDIEGDYTNYSTAYDIAILLKYALNNDIFREIFTTREYVVSSTGLVLDSTISAYGDYYNLDTSNILGAKSGFTDLAGLCLASIYTYDAVDYLLVTLGADISNRSNAVRDSLIIYEYYSSNYGYKTVIDSNTIIETIPVKWGVVDEYNIRTNNDIELYINNNLDLSKLEYNYEGIEEITNDIIIGSKLGTVDIIYKGDILTSVDVYLNEDIEYYYPLLYMFIIFLFIFVFIIVRSRKRKKRRKRGRRK